jgi:hypothetical protein
LEDDYIQARLIMARRPELDVGLHQAAREISAGTQPGYVDCWAWLEKDRLPDAACSRVPVARVLAVRVFVGVGRSPYSNDQVKCGSRDEVRDVGFERVIAALVGNDETPIDPDLCVPVGGTHDQPQPVAHPRERDHDVTAIPA